MLLKRVGVMVGRAVLAALAGVALFAGEPAAIVGFVQGIDGDNLRIVSGVEKLVIHCDGPAQGLRPYEKVRIQVHRSLFGSLIADRVDASVSLSGVVSGTPEVWGFELTGSDGSSHEVQLTPATRFGPGRDELSQGLQILVTGWDLGGRRIEAERVAIYNTDAPVTKDK